MKQAIKVLEKRIELLKSDLENIELETLELQGAIEVLNSLVK